MLFGWSRSSRLVTGVCTAALAMGLGIPHAHAATSSDVRERAAKENERLSELVVQLEKGRKEVDGLDKKIDELAKESVKVQSELIEDRGQLRTMVSTSYRWGHAPSVWDIALSSETLDDFVSKVYYANKVTEWQTNCVEQLDEDKRELESQMGQIEETRNERKEALAQLEKTCTQVSASVESLLEMAEGLEAEERAAEETRLGEIAQRAAAQTERAQQQQTQSQATANARALAVTAATNPEVLEARAEDDDALVVALKTAIDQGEDPVVAAEKILGEGATDSTRDSQTQSNTQATQEGGADKGSTEAEASEAGVAQSNAAEPAAETNAQEGSQDGAQPAGEETPETEGARVDDAAPEGEEAPAEAAPADDGGDWIDCIASAYTIADNWPPGSTATASGIPLDESVPTVALPISSNPSQYYGSQVQIEYGDTTVIATVTDCGGMGGGSRGLDLTPAVYEALGAESGDDWGLREVRYRFL